MNSFAAIKHQRCSFCGTSPVATKSWNIITAANEETYFICADCVAIVRELHDALAGAPFPSIVTAPIPALRSQFV